MLTAYNDIAAEAVAADLIDNEEDAYPKISGQKQWTKAVLYSAVSGLSLSLASSLLMIKYA